MALAAPASASEIANSRASDYFATSSTYLWKTSGTTFQAWIDITAVEGMQELGASEVRIQRSADGINWSTMYTYTKELYPQLIATNTCTHAAYVTYTGSAGYYYRAFVVYYAKNSSGTGEAYRYTASLKL